MKHLVKYAEVSDVENKDVKETLFDSTYADPDVVAEEFVHAFRGTRVLQVQHQPLPGASGGAQRLDSATGIAGTGNRREAGEPEPVAAGSTPARPADARPSGATRKLVGGGQSASVTAAPNSTGQPSTLPGRGPVKP